MAAAMLAASLPFALITSADAQVLIGLSVNIAPPALPVYVQPPLPAPGYIWTPGYWSWNGSGYFWVPGTWVQAPQPGLLWTPGYWGWNNGVYVFNAGYWGPHVGFYGGISYGFGYTGSGFQGGYWNNGSYFYNNSVNNVSNTNVTNVYNKTVVNNTTTNVSYNGGVGGIAAKPTAAEMAAAKEPHVAPTAQQAQNQQAARQNPALLASNNHGRPPIAATAHPGVFKGPGVVAAGAAAKPKPGGAAPAVGPKPEAEKPAPSAGAGPKPEKPDFAAEPKPKVEKATAPPNAPLAAPVHAAAKPPPPRPAPPRRAPPPPPQGKKPQPH